MKVQEGGGIHKESTFGDLFWKNVSTMNRLNYDGFYSLIRVVGSSVEWKNTHMRKNILIETKVAMALTWLNNENPLQMCGEFYGIAKNITSIIMREFSLASRKPLKPLMISKLIKDKIKEITVGLVSLHGIPYILSAIDGNYISIVTPKVDQNHIIVKKGYTPHWFKEL